MHGAIVDPVVGTSPIELGVDADLHDAAFTRPA